MHESALILPVGSQNQARNSGIEVCGGFAPGKHSELNMKWIPHLTPHIFDLTLKYTNLSRSLRLIEGSVTGLQSTKDSHDRMEIPL